MIGVNLVIDSQSDLESIVLNTNDFKLLLHLIGLSLLQPGQTNVRCIQTVLRPQGT